MKLFVLSIILCSCATQSPSKFANIKQECLISPGIYEIMFEEIKSTCDTEIKIDKLPNIVKMEKYVPCEKISKEGSKECELITHDTVDLKNNTGIIIFYVNCGKNVCNTSIRYKFKKIK